MEFGRLKTVAGVDFTLPPDAAANGEVLAGGAASGRVLLGLSGWSDREFVGKLYPAGARPGAFLEHYGRAFPTNELNSTYYGFSAERFARWAAAVPEGFRFCPKLPQEVTHGRGLRDVDGEMERFADALARFDGKVGRVWGTLASSFGPDRVKTLASFVRRWAPRVPLALELRHADWFASAAAGEAIFGLFREHGVVAILTDVAGRRDVLHMRLTAPETFVRFVGNALHPTDFARLDDWVARIASWREQGLETAYVFFHQKSDPQTVDLARHFARRFEERFGLDLLPELRVPAVQGDLF